MLVYQRVPSSKHARYYGNPLVSLGNHLHMVDLIIKKKRGEKLAPNIQFEISIKKTNMSDVKIDHIPFKSNFLKLFSNIGF